jgi:hypothetical protein
MILNFAFPILIYVILNGFNDYSPVTCAETMDSYSFPTNIELHQNKDLILNKNISVSNCKLCDYPVRNSKPNSSKRDVVIASSIGKVVNIILFVKTLRTTGSKANCVFLLDDVSYNSLSNKTRDIVVRCVVK